MNVFPGVHIETHRLKIGRYSILNQGVWIDNVAEVTIGEHCAIGQQVMLCTSSHDMGARAQRAGLAASRPIVIDDGAWVGARAVVLGGVTIASGCVVAAGSVVTVDTEPDGLYAGVPAVRKKDLLGSVPV
ncbi:MAG: DapH/DapD/GlmU-related protein [Rhodococcus sp. (in: high G+C Gram-positive bacteria)]|uniref:acyltransferase n=1 Tax=Rhodococcus sp. TaxID=1831 RepID=UPI003BB21A8A